MEHEEIQSIIRKLKGEVAKVIIEQEEVADFCIAAMLSGGHLLIEGVPGLAKTLFARTFAKTMSLTCNRIQFTPDLMPSDIIGTKMFNMQERVFELKKGPVFANLILADEINRTPPKTQSALLEAMQDESVSIDGDTMAIPMPFMVMATQNPIEYEGTYSLPEALIDRFLFKVSMDYPTAGGEAEVLKRLHGLHAAKMTPENCEVLPVCTGEQVLEMRRAVSLVKVEDALIRYMVEIVRATRESQLVENGSSPRGCIALLTASKAWAVMAGRDYVLPEDIKQVALPSLRHRLILKPEVTLDGVKADDVLSGILDQVKVPR